MERDPIAASQDINEDCVSEEAVSEEEKKRREAIHRWAVDQSRESFRVAKLSELNLSIDGLQFYQHIPGGLGSSGCFACKSDKGHFIVKEAKTPVETLFASYLGHELCSRYTKHIHLPKLRVVRRDDDMFACIIDQLCSLETHRNQRTYADRPRIHRLSNLQYIFIIEFMTGRILYAMDPTTLPNLFSTEMLAAIGGTLVFDMLINNYDRLPVIWRNEGNASNFVFQNTEEQSKDNPTIALIDQSVTAIVPKGRPMYYEKVAKFTECAFSACETGQPGTCLGQLPTMMNDVSLGSYAFDANSQLAVLKGFCSVVKRMVEGAYEFKEMVGSVTTKVKQNLDTDAVDVMAMLKNVEEFVIGVFDQFKEHAKDVVE